MDLESCYRVLGVRNDADLSEIKSAFRRLALEYHPDRNKSPDAVTNFDAIAEAYSVIMGHHGVVDGWNPVDERKQVFEGEAIAKLSFSIMRGDEVVYHVPPEMFESEIRRRFNRKVAPTAFCKIGRRSFEMDDKPKSSLSLFPRRSGKPETLTEWRKTPDGTDRWRTIEWEDFWSYVREYASSSLTVA